MADIKVNEDKYFVFLNTVKNYIDNTKELELKVDVKEDGTWMIDYIERELKIRELMIARRTYYDFYVKVHKNNEKAANEAYQKYIEAKEEIDNIRGQRL